MSMNTSDDQFTQDLDNLVDMMDNCEPDLPELIDCNDVIVVRQNPLRPALPRHQHQAPYQQQHQPSYQQQQQQPQLQPHQQQHLQYIRRQQYGQQHGQYPYPAPPQQHTPPDSGQLTGHYGQHQQGAGSAAQPQPMAITPNLPHQ